MQMVAVVVDLVFRQFRQQFQLCLQSETVFYIIIKKILYFVKNRIGLNDFILCEYYFINEKLPSREQRGVFDCRIINY